MTDNLTVYADTTTVAWHNSVAEVWLWYAFREPIPATAHFPESDRSLRRVRLDCRKRTSQVLQVVNYYYGEYVSQRDMSGDAEIRTWTPESVGESVGELTCHLIE